METFKNITLRDYQTEAVSAVLTEPKGLVVAATAAGKTTMMSQAIYNQLEQSPEAKVLVLVHTISLVSQLRNRLSKETGKKVASFLGEQKDSFAAPIVVSTWQSMSNLQERPGGITRDHFTHIHVDEAHNARSPKYENTVVYFDPRTLHGYTATLEGNGKNRILDVFGPVIYEIGLFDLIDRGHLSKLQVLVSVSEEEGVKEMPTYTNKKFEMIRSMGRVGERPRKMLHFFSRNRRFRIFSEHSLLPPDSFQEVSAETPRKQREDIFQRFSTSTSKLNHLLTNRVLNEGIDLPAANAIVLHEAIGDYRVIIQRIGRGVRIDPRNPTDTTLVMIFVDSGDDEQVRLLEAFLGQVEREYQTRGVDGKRTIGAADIVEDDNTPTDHTPVTLSLIDKTEQLLNQASANRKLQELPYSLDEFIEDMRGRDIMTSGEYIKWRDTTEPDPHTYPSGRTIAKQFKITERDMWSRVRFHDYHWEEFRDLMRKLNLRDSSKFRNIEPRKYLLHGDLSHYRDKFGFPSFTKIMEAIRGRAISERKEVVSCEEFLELMAQEGIRSQGHYRQWLRGQDEDRKSRLSANIHCKYGITCRELWISVREYQDQDSESHEARGETEAA